MEGSDEKRRVKRAIHILLLVVVLSYCASKPDLIGKWREVGKTATIAIRIRAISHLPL